MSLRRLNIIVSLAFCVLLAACGGDTYIDTTDLGEPGVEGDRSSGDIYLHLRFNTLGSSRSGDDDTSIPASGDALHPDRTARQRENRISNLTIFVFGSDIDIDGAGSTTPLYSRYISPADIAAFGSVSGADFSTTSAVVVIPESDNFKPSAGMRVMALANMGDLTSLSDLAAIRDYRPSVSRSSDDPAVAKNFSMGPGSLTDGIISGTGDKPGTIDNPYSASVSLERLAARIDYLYDNATPADGYIDYEITGDDGKVADVRLTHILPFNLMQHPGYAAKRITDPDKTTIDLSSLSCFGDTIFSPAADCGSAAYVIDPFTLSKAAGTADKNYLYGTTAASGYIDGSFSSAPSITTVTGNADLQVNETGVTRCVTLAYTDENTHHILASTSDYITGLLVKAVYVPSVVYSYDADGGLKRDESYTPGTTFWRLTPDRETMLESNSLYFTSGTEAGDYAAAHRLEDAVWRDPVKYDCGECYYSVFLRHVLPDPTADPLMPYVMEYGTVRNHIYRVSFTFSGPGSPGVDIREPRSMTTELFVRKWNLRSEPSITM